MRPSRVTFAITLFVFAFCASVARHLQPHGMILPLWVSAIVAISAGILIIAIAQGKEWGRILYAIGAFIFALPYLGLFLGLYFIGFFKKPTSVLVLDLSGFQLACELLGLYLVFTGDSKDWFAPERIRDKKESIGTVVPQLDPIMAELEAEKAQWEAISMEDRDLSDAELARYQQFLIKRNAVVIAEKARRQPTQEDLVAAQTVLSSAKSEAAKIRGELDRITLSSNKKSRKNETKQLADPSEAGKVAALSEKYEFYLAEAGEVNLLRSLKRS